MPVNISMRFTASGLAIASVDKCFQGADRTRANSDPNNANQKADPP